MSGLKLAFILVSVILLTLAAVGVPAGRGSLLAAGLAFFAAASLPV